MQIHAQIDTEGNVPLQPKQRDYFKNHIGKKVIIEIDERESKELRGFFEGAIVPVWYYLNPLAGWKSFADARDNIKLEFNGRTIRDRNAREIRIAKSTMMSTLQWEKFIGRIMDYFKENGMLQWYPDPTDYKLWRDTERAFSEEPYPPIKKLKEMYERARGEVVSAWRR